MAIKWSSDITKHCISSVKLFQEYVSCFIHSLLLVQPQFSTGGGVIMSTVLSHCVSTVCACTGVRECETISVRLACMIGECEVSSEESEQQVTGDRAVKQNKYRSMSCTCRCDCNKAVVN